MNRLKTTVDVNLAATSAALMVKMDAAIEASRVLATSNANTAGTVSLMSADIARIKEDLKEVREYQKSSAKEFVGFDDFTEHLKADADHEARLRMIEAKIEDFPLVKKLVYGCVGLILTAVVLAIIYLVIKR